MTKKEKKNIKKEVDRCCWRAKERKTTRIKFIECVNPIEKILILTISKWEIKRNAKKKKTKHNENDEKRQILHTNPNSLN